MDKYINKLFFLIGLFSTLGAVMINVKGTDLAIVNIFIIAVLVIQFFNGKFHMYKYKIGLLLIFVCMVCSVMVNINYLPGRWLSESIKATIKFVCLICPFFILFSDEELLRYRKKFFKGLHISAYIQLVWELLQIVLWHIKGLSINQIIFGNLLGIQTEHNWTFISDGRFRPSGVSWEPANLSLALVIGYCLSKNRYSKLIFIMGIILSSSRTGIILMVICIACDVYHNIKNTLRAKKIRITIGSILFSIGIISIVLIIILAFADKIDGIVSSIYGDILITIDKLSMKTLNTDSSANVHLSYYLNIKDIFRNIDIDKWVFGCGTMASGLPYSNILQIYTWKSYWNPESDFITILVGNGILGFVLYYSFILKNIKLNIKNHQYRMIIISILFSGILYVYIRSSWTFIILILLFVKENEQKENQVKGY